MTSEGSSKSGIGALGLAVTAFSFGFILVKAVRLPAATTATYRLLLAAAVMGLAIVWRRERFPRLSPAVLGAGVFFGLHQLLYVRAAQRTSIAIVTLIAALQPLLVALVSRRFLGERVPRALLLWSLVAVSSVALVVHANLDDASRTLGGDLLAVLNLFVFTGYFLCAKRARDQGAPTLTLTLLIALVALLIVAPTLVPVSPRVPPTAWQWLLLLTLAAGPANGHLLLNWAHGRVSAAFGSLMLSLVPLLSSVWAHFVFAEPYGWKHAVGMLLAAAAIEGGRRAEAKRRASLA